MPPKKRGATRTIEIVAAVGHADVGPATVCFPYTGHALEGATKVDIEYTAVVCASLLGCTKCAADHVETMDVAHLKSLKRPTSLAQDPAMLEEYTDTPRVRYTQQDSKVYLRATRGNTGTWTLVSKAEPTILTP